MRLAEFLAPYPAVRLADESDNGRILEFFEQKPLGASALEVQYLRRPDFFGLLRYQGDRVFVFVADDGRGGIRGVGSLTLRPGWVDGKPATVGYLGDLRVAGDRVLARLWRKLFFELISRASEIEEIADCAHWHTVVIDGNRRYLNAFDGSKGRSDRLCLVPIGPFTMRNLILRLPFRKRRLSGTWTVKAAGPEDAGTLAAFFESENRGLPLGFRGEFGRRLANWQGLRLEDFVFAEDGQGPAACLAPWYPDPVKRTLVSRVPASLRLLGLGARALPRPPLRIPEAGQRLRAPYLTHLAFAARLDAAGRAEAFRAMLDMLFDRWRREGADWHCVSFCDFEDWGLGRALGGFVQQTVPITVYAVAPPDRAAAAEALRAAGPPAFEMALV